MNMNKNNRRNGGSRSRLIIPGKIVPWSSLSNAKRTTYLAQQQAAQESRIAKVVSAMGDLTDLTNWIAALVRSLEVTLELEEGALLAAVEAELSNQRKLTAEETVAATRENDISKAKCLGAKALFGMQFKPERDGNDD